MAENGAAPPKASAPAADHPRTSHGQASRALLRRTVLDAVDALLAERPWAAVTMSQIARAAGVSRQTLYNEFGTREALVRDYVLWAAETFLDEVEEVVTAHSADLNGAFEAAFEQFLAIAAEHPLIRALEATSGAEGLGALAAGSTGEAVVEMASHRLAGHIEATWPALPTTEVRDLAEVMVRLAISHLVIPTQSSRGATRQAGRVLRPEIDRLSVHLTDDGR